MARALIVGCGCRGRELGAALGASGWQVRGTTRDRRRAAEIERAGVEPALADPAAAGTVLDAIEGVAIVYWLLGSAAGDEENLRAIHGTSLEALLERLVDTPVRGLVYEGAGGVENDVLDAGARVARAASERWRIPVEVLTTEPDDRAAWLGAALAAGERALLQR